MTHPEELLAGYVDGTLTEKERAAVDAHLATCGTCREELDLASRARVVLSELTEVDVPLGVTRPVLAEIATQMARPRPVERRARVFQWAAGLAAAAAVVAFFAVVGGPGGGGGGGGGMAASPVPAAGGDAGLQEAASALAPLERQANVDYDASKVAELARSVAEQITAATVASPPEKAASTDAAAAAMECVRQGSSVTENDRLARLIDAKFDGKPAYIAVYLESPGAGQPPTKVVVWIVAKQGCSLLSFASQRI